MSRDKYDIANLENLSLYPKVRLPYGFKWPDIDKYNGTRCIRKYKKKRLTLELLKARCMSELYSPWKSTMSYLSNYSKAV